MMDNPERPPKYVLDDDGFLTLNPEWEQREDGLTFND